MKRLLTLFGGGWGWVIAHPELIALAVALAFGGVQTWRLGNAHEKIAALSADLAGQKMAVSLQNTMIDALDKWASEKAAMAKSMLDAANDQAATHAQTATTIINRPVPTPDKECEATLDLLREFQK